MRLTLRNMGDWPWLRAVRFPALYFVLSTLLSLYYFSPVCKHFSSKMLGHHIDRYFSLWAINWAIQQKYGLAGDLFTANILYPHQDNLLFSASFLGQAVLALPLTLAGAGAATLYNTLLILGVVISATAAAMLGAELVKNRWAALVTLVCFGFFPARAMGINHVNLQYSFALPLCLWAFWIFTQKGKNWAIYATGLVLAIQAYFSMQMMLWGLWALALAAPVFLLVGKPWRRLSKLCHWGIAMVVSLAVLAPLAVGYARMGYNHGFTRSMRETIHYSGSIDDFYNDRGVLRFDPWVESVSREEAGYLGVLVCVLALVGLLVLLVRALRHRPKELWCFGLVSLLLVAAGILFFLGPVLKEHGDARLPFWWLRQWFPGFSGVRAPARALVLSHLGLAILATVGVAGVGKLLRFRVANAVLAVCAAALVFYFFLPKPRGTSSLRPPTKMAQVIKTLPSDAVVLPWPSFASWHPAAYQNWDAVEHERTIVGGYSGIFTPLYRALYMELDSLPEPRALRVAAAIGITHLVVNERSVGSGWKDLLGAAVQSGQVEGPIKKQAGYAVYRLPTKIRRAGLQQWQSYLPLKVLGPTTVQPSTFVSHALQLPESFAQEMRVEWRTYLNGAVALKCQDQSFAAKARFTIPPIIERHRREITASWEVPQYSGDCLAQFEARGHLLGELPLRLGDLSDTSAKAQIEIASFPQTIRVATHGELVLQIKNLGGQHLFARSSVEHPWAKGEFQFECTFNGSKPTKKRSAAEWALGALTYDLQSGQSVVSHHRLKAPKVVGSYLLTCRPLEAYKKGLGPVSQAVSVEVVR